MDLLHTWLEVRADQLVVVVAKSYPQATDSMPSCLQNSLGGNAKALMFVNVSPAAESAAESLCSLRFAAKVNACEVGTARRNVVAAK